MKRDMRTRKAGWAWGVCDKCKTRFKGDAIQGRSGKITTKSFYCRSCIDEEKEEQGKKTCEKCSTYQRQGSEYGFCKENHVEVGAEEKHNCFFRVGD